MSNQLLDRVRNTADAREAGVATMTVVSAIQDMSSEAQVHGITAAFALLCERLEVRPSQLLDITENLMDKSDGYRPEFRGAKAYMENDLL